MSEENGGDQKFDNALIEFEDVGEIQEESVEGLAAIKEAFRGRHDLATEYVRAAVARVDNPVLAISLIERSFPGTDEAEIENAVKRISGAPYTGGMPPFWQIHPGLRGAARTRYNRDATLIRFGPAQVGHFSAIEALFPDIRERVHPQGVLLPPAVLLAYPLTVLRLGREDVNLSGVMVEARFMEMFWYVDRGRNNRFLKASAGGFAERDWDESAVEYLGQQKARVDQSVKTAVRVARRRMAHPYRGGLPGLGGSG